MPGFAKSPIVPTLRGKRGTRHRVLIVAVSYEFVLLIFVVAGRMAVPS